jgi:hypothetical protein
LDEKLKQGIEIEWREDEKNGLKRIGECREWTERIKESEWGWSKKEKKKRMQQTGWQEMDMRMREVNRDNGKTVNREDWKRIIRADGKRVIREDEMTMNIDDENWMNKNIRREWSERTKRKVKRGWGECDWEYGKKVQREDERIWTKTQKNENSVNKKNVNRDEE